MTLLEKKISLELTIAEAIVITNFITRQSENMSEISSFSEDEKRALWNLECLLEKELTEPLITNYEETLVEAKKFLTK